MPGKSILVKTKTSKYSKPRPSFQMNIQKLPQDILLDIRNYLDLPSACTLAISCRSILESLFPTNFKFFAHKRFNVDTSEHQTRITYESIESSWKMFYQRLDTAVCGFNGWCLDPANALEPYPMELVIQSSEHNIYSGDLSRQLVKDCSSIDGIRKCHAADLVGFCRWRRQGDALTRVALSLTKVDASIIDADQMIRFKNQNGRSIARNIVFEETLILRGSGIAIPNRYYGYVIGSIILGMFDPGDLTLPGVFVLIMEEAIQVRTLTCFTGQYMIGTFLFASLYPRIAHQCHLVVHEESPTGAIQARFEIEISRMSTTCKQFEQSSKRIGFQVNGVRDMCSNSIRAEFRADDVNSDVQLGILTIRCIGMNWFCLFSNPRTGCFYLEDSARI